MFSHPDSYGYHSLGGYHFLHACCEVRKETLGICNCGVEAPEFEYRYRYKLIDLYRHLACKTLRLARQMTNDVDAAAHIEAKLKIPASSLASRAS